jgi:hypothetical protein
MMVKPYAMSAEHIGIYAVADLWWKTEKRRLLLVTGGARIVLLVP